MDRDFTVHDLPDTSRLLMIPMPKCKTFTLHMSTRYGSHNVKTKKDYETAHFLEHLVAELTSKKFPHSKENKQEMAKRGISWNAFTQNDKTVYIYKGLSIHLKFVLKMLFHAYHDFLIDPEIFEQERKAVRNELKAYMSNPNHELRELLNTFLFQDNEIIRDMKLQTEYENVANTTQQQLMDIWNVNYHGDSILFAIAGGFDPTTILKSFTKYLVPNPRLSYQKRIYI